MKKILLLLSVLTLANCGGTQVIDMDNTTEKAGMSNVMGLEYRDFEKASDKMVDDMLASGALDKSNGKYIMAVSRVKNDTMQDIDTDLLTKKMRVQLMKSGKVSISNAVTADGSEDPLIAKTRNMRYDGKDFEQVGGSTSSAVYADGRTNVSATSKTAVYKDNRNKKEFKQSTIAKQGTLVVPDVSLSGKIIQRNLKVSSSKTRVEYYFQMSLTDLSSGLTTWEDETPIVKQGKTSNTPIW